MSDDKKPFIDLCLSGDALSTEIDDFIDRWHDGDGNGQSLAEYLGMTDEEYALWVERPEVLSCICFARREDVPFADARRWADSVTLAARASGLGEAERLKEWLMATGRL